MAASVARKPEQSVHDLCRGVQDGSSYMAFLLACRLRPTSVHDLLGPLGKTITTKAFDAGVDGYRVWQDARSRGLLR